MEICGTETLNSPLSKEFWTEHDMQMEEYGKEQGFILKAPKNKETRFQCPNSDFTFVDPLHYYADFNASPYTVTADGRLHGKNIEYQHQMQVHKGNFSWDNERFCVSFADLDYDDDYESDGVFQHTFYTCYDSSLPKDHCQAHADFLAYFRCRFNALFE